jgi:adenylate cyclase
MQAVDTYSFQTHWGVPTSEHSGPSTVAFQEQDFYKHAVAAKALHISEPHLLKNTGDLGITIGSAVSAAQQTAGVIAVDMDLKMLSRFLDEHRATPNSLTLLTNEAEEIVAHPQYALGIAKKGADPALARLNKLNDPRVLAALGERLRTGKDRFTFRAGDSNTEYLALFSPFPKEFNTSWELITIAPTADFVGEIQRNNRDLLIFSLIAFFVQIALIYMISRMIARPIEQLAREVMDIREFRFDRVKRINSPVSEIRHLSDAISLLERALESFISYVPTVLVKQLLESGQGTKLGVESRFLTVFFTDIEGFSGLSESEPSQQLLSHVSDYFSTVTRAIEREQGTVDKFIGDAVMAFWGAPKVLDNHAYLACVAAIRSQRGMMKLNKEWMEQKMPPLKLRIGIHCDAVLVGNIGSTERVSYTVMGDGVNVAARLEGINKEMGTWICVSHNVYREAGHLLCLRPIDTVTVKGRKAELLVYELLGTREGDAEIAASAEQLALCELTKEAYAQFINGRFDNAATAYAAILEQFPDDPVAHRMLEKSRAHSVKLAFA